MYIYRRAEGVGSSRFLRSVDIDALATCLLAVRRRRGTVGSGVDYSKTRGSRPAVGLALITANCPTQAALALARLLRFSRVIFPFRQWRRLDDCSGYGTAALGKEVVFNVALACTIL